MMLHSPQAFQVIMASRTPLLIGHYEYSFWVLLSWAQRFKVGLEINLFQRACLAIDRPFDEVEVVPCLSILESD